MSEHPDDNKVVKPAVVKPSRKKFILYWFVFVVTYFLCIAYTVTFFGHLYEHSEFNVIVTLAYCVMAVFFLFVVDRREWSEYFHRQNKALNLILVLVPAVTAALDVFKDELLKLYTDDYWIMCLVLAGVFAALGVGLLIGLNKIFILLQEKYPDYFSK